MQPNHGASSKGFLTFDEAIKIIQAETREKPNVDISKITKNAKWIEKGHNFTIFFIKRDASGKIVPNGNRPVQIASDYEATTLEHTIAQKYKELAGRDFRSPIHKISTMVTDAESGGNMEGRPVENLESAIKEGDLIGGNA